jgi:hypothetical protein
MLKSGLIVGAITTLIMLGTTLVLPLCTPCLAIFLGIAAGYLAGMFDKPLDNGSSAKKGAGAGGIGGIGSLVGVAIGQALNGLIVGPEGAANMLEQFGLQTSSSPVGYWFGVVGGAVCFGLLGVALMAGMGAVGGLLWWQVTGKNANPPGADAI